MNARAAAAYGTVQRATRAVPRNAEAELLRKRATEIESAASPIALVRALEGQRDLWIVLTTDLVSPANALPPSLRATLLNISQWILADLDKETPAYPTHIAINRQIALGLCGNAG